MVVVVHNIGYKVFVGQRVAEQLNEGEEVMLHTHQYLRENASELYGFLSHDEVDFFKRLIDLSDVGPKSALNILDIASLEDLLLAIRQGQAKLLTKASGIGPRIAERIVVELKDKIDFALPQTPQAPKASKQIEAIEALEGLGFTTTEAREALRQVPADVKSTAEIVKLALRSKGKT